MISPQPRSHVFHCRLLVPLALILTLSTATAQTDIVHLKHGGKVEGTIVEEGKTLTVKTRLGTVRIDAGEVASIERGPSVTERYEARLAALADPGDIALRLDLAQWCENEKHSKGRREQYEAILAIDPDHAGARQALGHEQRDGVWITAEDIARERAAARAARNAQQKKQLDELRQRTRQQRQLERWVRELAYGSQSRCDKAYTELQAFAKETGRPHIAKEATRIRDLFDDYWRKVRARRDQVGVEVNATQSKLTRPIGSVTTPLGGSSPVTIQLPRMQVTSVRTTVWIPAGRGK